MRENQNDIIISIREDDDNYFNTLSPELIAYIFSYLDEESISAISQVCKHFFDIIIHNTNLIFYERFCKDHLSLLPSGWNVLLYYSRSKNFDEVSNSLQSFTNLINNKKTLNKLSPFKFNNFFKKLKELAQKEKEIDNELNNNYSSNKNLATIFLAPFVPIVIGYLSGSITMMLIGFSLGVAIMGCGIYKRVDNEAQLTKKNTNHISSVHRLFNLVGGHSALAYDEKTLDFIKKYS
ncbi:MAG: hypothetical protein A3F12_00985 [Gammaproteobacteria bacterium RIFCSPHIGHO2_12_FULL_38_14]|nr:MAG: hypothetical protein A3F12_00985 [Gammaproteobacteria bacterium RIFCSPHIGHO2_12_FULL_38_14]